MRAAVMIVLAACVRPPVPNEIVAKSNGRHIEYRAPVAAATLCKSCKDAPVTVTFGAPPRFQVTIPSCYPHAQSKIGDKDHVAVEDLDSHVVATSGELDITDCITSHLTAKLWAAFPDGVRIDVTIDTALTDPGA